MNKLLEKEIIFGILIFICVMYFLFIVRQCAQEENYTDLVKAQKIIQSK